MSDKLSRRDFLKTSGKLALGAAAGTAAGSLLIAASETIGRLGELTPEQNLNKIRELASSAYYSKDIRETTSQTLNLLNLLSKDFKIPDGYGIYISIAATNNSSPRKFKALDINITSKGTTLNETDSNVPGEQKTKPIRTLTEFLYKDIGNTYLEYVAIEISESTKNLKKMPNILSPVTLPTAPAVNSYIKTTEIDITGMTTPTNTRKDLKEWIDFIAEPEKVYQLWHGNYNQPPSLQTTNNQWFVRRNFDINNKKTNNISDVNEADFKQVWQELP